jgi:hypothetical protein
MLVAVSVRCRLGKLNVVIYAATVGAIALLVPWPKMAAARSSPDLILTATSESVEYALAEPIAIQLSLGLAPTALSPGTVSTFPLGSVCVHRVEHDGRKVKPAKGRARFYHDPRILQSSAGCWTRSTQQDGRSESIRRRYLTRIVRRSPAPTVVRFTGTTP